MYAQSRVRTKHTDTVACVWKDEDTQVRTVRWSRFPDDAPFMGRGEAALAARRQPASFREVDRSHAIRPPTDPSRALALPTPRAAHPLSQGPGRLFEPLRSSDYCVPV